VKNVVQKTTHSFNKTLEYDKIVYALETPKYHMLQFDANNRFSGWVFYFGEKAIDRIKVNNNGQFVGEFAVDGVREDVGNHVPSMPAAKTCGFAFDIPVEKTAKNLTFEIVFDEGEKELFFEFDVAYAFSQQTYLNQLRQEIASIHKPDGDLVYLTQGHHNIEEYQNSIIPGVLNMCQYLEHAGVDLKTIHSLLDFGCGSGRYLIGWHLIAPHIALHGCDLNAILMSWAQKNLPDPIQCLRNNLMPPLPYQDNQFELIYLISVFTHLSLDVQKIWIQELKRILKVGGYILLTLHGELYVRNNFLKSPEKIEEFMSRGFTENGSPSDEGANQYGTYHAPQFIDELFEEFQWVGYFPNGRIDNRRTLFQIAQSQDVYVFQYEGS
jgi:SAM-dependent methyltransferase